MPPHNNHGSSEQHNDTVTSNVVTIPSSLTRQCLQLHHPEQRFANEAVDLTSELLRLFVLEARRRAAIEAECEAASMGDIENCDLQSSTEEDNSIDNGNNNNNATKRKVLEIRSDHIAKIAAELLMDVS